MNYETWDNVIKHLFLLCGIRKMDKEEHALYIANMFSELKNKFNNETIAIAARQIAENENLYGSYPPLSIWLKYCPQQRANQIANNSMDNNFMSAVRQIIYCDFIHGTFFDDMQECIDEFGSRGNNVLNQFGGVKSIYANYRKSSDFMKEQFLREIKKTWDESAIDVVIGTLELSPQPFNLIGKK